MAILITLAACATNDPAIAPNVSEEAFVKPSTFEVFFDVDQSALSDAARETLHDVALNAAKHNLHHVTISIHPHASGWDLHSEALAQQRAEAVKKVLIAEGVPAFDIGYVAILKDLLSSAEDGVRDPANRRTEITIK